jgi:hypothetical protein
MTRIRRILTALATLAGALLAFTAASPAALAIRVPPPGGGSGAASGVARTVPWPKTPTVPAPPQVHTVVVGGMPGWQIALIAIAAATVAVLLDRAWSSARKAHATTA